MSTKHSAPLAVQERGTPLAACSPALGHSAMPPGELRWRTLAQPLDTRRWRFGARSTLLPLPCNRPAGTRGTGDPDRTSTSRSGNNSPTGRGFAAIQSLFPRGTRLVPQVLRLLHPKLTCDRLKANQLKRVTGCDSRQTKRPSETPSRPLETLPRRESPPQHQRQAALWAAPSTPAAGAADRQPRQTSEQKRRRLRLRHPSHQIRCTAS